LTIGQFEAGTALVSGVKNVRRNIKSIIKLEGSEKDDIYSGATNRFGPKLLVS